MGVHTYSGMRVPLHSHVRLLHPRLLLLLLRRGKREVERFEMGVCGVASRVHALLPVCACAGVRVWCVRACV